MKTICNVLIAALAVGVLSLAFVGCGDVSGRIGLGKYGDVTSGTYNLDLSPVIDDMMPAPKSYTPVELYPLPPLEK